MRSKLSVKLIYASSVCDTSIARVLEYTFVRVVFFEEYHRGILVCLEPQDRFAPMAACPLTVPYMFNEDSLQGEGGKIVVVLQRVPKKCKYRIMTSNQNYDKGGPPFSLPSLIHAHGLLCTLRGKID